MKILSLILIFLLFPTISYAEQLKWQPISYCLGANRWGPPAFEAFNKRPKDALDKLDKFHAALVQCVDDTSKSLDDNSTSKQTEDTAFCVALLITDIMTVDYLEARVARESGNTEKYVSVFKDMVGSESAYGELDTNMNLPNYIKTRFHRVTIEYNYYIAKYPLPSGIRDSL